ncbi:hypothetical protein GYMLUDRAFT_729406 [Collybiopsis luxurians FD-317 M1]|nr:hypothetical protein GYMLUDRAFT_729406 [Collybiopsis luxurians FD-317 M1]
MDKKGLEGGGIEETGERITGKGTKYRTKYRLSTATDAAPPVFPQQSFFSYTQYFSFVQIPSHHLPQK